MSERRTAVADPFDLPEWLATGDVVWRADDSVVGGGRVGGTLTGQEPEQRLVLDLLAVDAAVPGPVCEEVHRTEAHHAWQRGESLLLDVDGRVTIAVPGYAFDADLATEALRRFTRAIGAKAGSYAVQIRL